MKKLLSLALCFAMLLALVPFSAFNVFAATYTDPQGVLYALSDDGTYYTVTGFDESVTSVVLPAEINGVPVTTIGDEAFYACASLTSIEIPDSVTTIGEYAFQWCESLKIEIPDSVTEIGVQAFCYCESLISVVIPNSVTTIGEHAFYHCAYLTNIYCYAESQPAGWSSDWLGNCTATVHWGYKSSDEPEATYTDFQGVTYTLSDDGTYYTVTDCHQSATSASVVIPAEINGVPVTTIGNEAFNNCNSLTSVVIGNSVTTIGKGAFSYCNSLTSIVILDSVTTIGYRAFSCCSSLEEIIVDNENEYYYSENNCLIEKSTNTLISGCKNSVIPNSVTTIDKWAFAHCTSLTSIAIPDSVTTIDEAAFYYCTSLTSIVIPNSVTTIGKCAFDDCRSLTSIVIPNSVTTIDKWAFSDCTSLTDIYCEAESQPDGWSSYWLDGCDATVHWGDGNIIPPGGSEFPATVTDSQGVKYTLVNTYYVIIDCDTSVTSVVIPAEINGIPVSQINQSAFVDCANLTSITIPASITGIGININYGLNSNPFAGCSALETIIIDGNNEYYHVDGNCIIETKTKSLISGFSNSIIPSDGSVTEIDNGAFESCVDLTSIEIPDNITTIWYYSFSGCTSLTDIYCEAESQPDGWSSDWLDGCDATVHWGYKSSDDDTSSEPEVIYDIQEDTNIEIEENNAFESGTIVSVVESIAEDVKETIKDALDTPVTIGGYNGTISDLLFGGNVKNQIFDFTAEKDGEAVQPKNPVIVIIPIPEGYSDKVVLKYLHPNGTLEDVEHTVDKENRKVTATIEHFSYYVLIDEGDLEYTLGDINANNKIDMTDYILLKRAYFGTYKFTEEQNKVGDINKNNKIDMTDYILLKRVYFGTYTIK